jgi:ABC-type glycerol-3-phosphate transport system permease component
MSLFPKVGRSQPRLRVAWWTVVVLLCLGVLLHLFPFYYMLKISFSPGNEVLSMEQRLWPKEPTTAAWSLVFNEVAPELQRDPNVRNLLPLPFWVYFTNSLFMTVMTLLISLPITALAAYANSKLQRGPLARWSFLFFIGTMMVPIAVTLIPSFLLTRNFPFAMVNAPTIPGTTTPFPVLRIWDTPWAVIIPGAFNAFNFLLFKGFFDTIPDSVIQAARVDGGSEFNIFRRIVFPMSVPVFAVAAWLQFGAVWDGFLWPLVVIQSPENIPASVAIYNLINRFTQAGTTSAEQAAGAAMANRELLAAGLSWNGLMVLGILQTLPIFVMFIICREYLMKGIRIRGLK